ncbi:MAG: peptidylprolyl isomerase [Chloroflexi bacterium]|nr:peptidylprolyl isomerase [Chloroflexota bacterium]
MNNRTLIGILGAVAALAIVLLVVQSLNIGQAQSEIAIARNTATGQAKGLAQQATLGAQFVTAAAGEATSAYEAGATTQANALAEAADTAATAQANTLADAEQAAATRQAEAIASAEAQATGTLSMVIAQASTAQAQAVEAAENAAAVQQEQALASAAVEATETLGAVVNAGATTQAEAEDTAATAQAQAVASVEAQAAATLGAVVKQDNTAEAELVATNRAAMSEQEESFSATQAAVEATITAISGQLATVTALPTIEPREPQTPAALCENALPASDPETRTFRRAEQVLQPNVDYFAILCTGAGPVYVDLFEKLTPVTVNNFVFLAQAGYYNNTTFHRVLPDFMAQGGDPTGTGTGGPGYEFGDEIVPSLRFDVPGRLAMANAGPNTNGSQFFITFGPQTYLDGDYSIFGQVVEGQANVRQIELRDPTDPGLGGTALDTVLIITETERVKLSETKLPTQEEVVAAMDRVDTLITSELASILENQKATQTTDEVVDAAPQAVQADLGAFFDTYHHLYRVSSVLTNLTCDASQIQFFSAGYTLDAYATEADAAAAVADPVLEQMALKSGYDAQRTSDMLPHPYFTMTETMCDQRMVRVMTFWRHGTFISTVSIVLPADIDGVSDLLDDALVGFVAGQIYEPFLTEILYSGIE